MQLRRLVILAVAASCLLSTFIRLMATLAMLAAILLVTSTGAAAQEQGKVLYSFGSSGGTDGIYPEAGLIFDAAGNLYGTTYNATAPPTMQPRDGGFPCRNPGKSWAVVKRNFQRHDPQPLHVFLAKAR